MSIKKIVIGFTLSLLLVSGVAVAANSHKELIAKWTHLAQKCDVKVQVNLGRTYFMGDRVPKNFKLAMKWFSLAAKQGNAEAQNMTGNMYDSGEGVLENDKTAVKWYTLAAKQGDEFGHYNLGRMYFSGSGVLTDYRRAYMWLNLAAYNGHFSASDFKVEVAEKMTRADISKAQEMSTRCLESNYTDC